MSTWIFQGNPTKFNVDDYLLDNDKIWWSIRQEHLAKHIQLNEEVFIWRSDGGNRGSGGIVARTLVTTLPQEYTNDNESANYWYADISGDTYLAVELKVLEVKVTNGIKSSFLKANHLLKELPILRLRNNTNYLLEENMGTYLSSIWKEGLSKKTIAVNADDVTILKSNFHQAMMNITEQTKKFGYNPTRFKKMLLADGGHFVAKKLLSSKTVSDGFSVLWENNALDLSVEAVVLQKEFRILFTAEELEIAEKRLSEFGYQVEEEELLGELELDRSIASDIEAELAEDGHGIEGKLKYYFGKRYERDSKNRKKAIKEHGINCYACGFNFEEVYGERGKDFIEVHHINPLSTLEEAVEINPETDLVPLCANCHRMIHRRKDDVLKIKELKEILRNTKG